MSGSYDRKDHFYNLAKSEGFRSRASFKLKELNKKYGLLKPGFKVADLGAWPGGWMQVASQAVGRRGLVVGIDLVEIEDFGQDNVKCITGDVRDDEVIAKAKEMAGGAFDLILSDMSPKLSGIKEVDRYGAVGCAELALWASSQLLKEGGSIVIKVFKSNETEEFIRELRKHFKKVVRSELDSTRKTSNEFYVIGFDSCQS